MDRKELNALIAKGPVKILLNDGRVFEVPSTEFALVGDVLAIVLVRGSDNKLRNMPLTLSNISNVEPLEQLGQSKASLASQNGTREKSMDRKELTQLISEGPILIRMNDGREYMVESVQFATVSDISAAVLYRDEEDGKYRHIHLPLVTMSGVERLSADI